jgi:hypothetical protein
LPDFFVEFRGKIHHHTQRKIGIWNPNSQERFEFEANVLQKIAFNVVMPLWEQDTYRDGVDLHEIKLLKRIATSVTKKQS